MEEIKNIMHEQKDKVKVAGGGRFDKDNIKTGSKDSQEKKKLKKPRKKMHDEL